MKKNEQAENSQTQSMATEDFRDFIRTSLDARVREFALGYVGALILEEIETLCGKAGEHKRDRGLAHRGGSQRGSIVLDGERVAIQKPRARRNVSGAVTASIQPGGNLCFSISMAKAPPSRLQLRRRKRS